MPPEYAWDSASNEAVADGLVVLEDYFVVDWALGEEAEGEDGTLNVLERAALATYLDSGRALLIGGTNLARDLATRAPSFLQNALHTGLVADDAGTFTAQPVAGGAFAGLADFVFVTPDEYRADAADVLSPVSGATSTLQYVGGTGGAAAIQYADGCRRLLVTGFPLEVVPSAPRAALMARALNYLSYCTLPHSSIVLPQAGGYYSVTPALAGTAIGWTLSGVKVQVQRRSDDAFWTGVIWGTETWLTPAGVDAWHYGLPALLEGEYTVRSRAEAEQVEAEPAVVSFTMDTTSPLTPTLITPTGSLLLRTPLLTFRWEPLADTGSPLTYYLEVGSRLFETSGTELVTALPSGTYTWRVRAIDAAGNVGPWSLDAVFEVDVEQVYLPLVFR